MARSTTPGYDPWTHRFAVGLVLLTGCLIVLGATVTSKGVGLAAPDWPTTFGYNMFLFPPSLWVGGLFWEHLHRLFGSAVGLLSIVVVVMLWWREPERRWLFRFGLGILAMVIVQGIMGGLRVTEMSIWLAVVHGVTGQVVLCAMVMLAVFTSRWWVETIAQSGNLAVSTPLRRIAYAVMAVLLIQVVLGATMRHHGAGLAIPDFPSAYGGLVPPLDQATLDAHVDALPYEEQAAYYSVAQVAVHFAHRVWAIVLFVVMGLWLGLVLKQSKQHPALIGTATAVTGILLVQLVLGALVIWTGRHPEIATAHTALGAALMGTTTKLAMRVHAVRHYAAAPKRAVQAAACPLPKGVAAA